MKSGNVSETNLFYTPGKPTREDKTTDRKGPDKSVGDNVDLSIKGQSVMAKPVASYDDAIDLLRNLDFRQAGDAHRIPGETVSILTEFLQA